jgi:glycerol-3-phosphate dehydrogenase
MAMRLDDALARRLDLATAGPPGAAAVAAVARVMAEELGWDEERARAEAERVAGARRHRLE